MPCDPLGVRVEELLRGVHRGAARCPGMRMAEQLLEPRLRDAVLHRMRGVGMPGVMDRGLVNPRGLADSHPRLARRPVREVEDLRVGLGGASAEPHVEEVVEGLVEATTSRLQESANNRACAIGYVAFSTSDSLDYDTRRSPTQQLSCLFNFDPNRNW